jgi:hypothetical protein
MDKIVQLVQVEQMPQQSVLAELVEWEVFKQQVLTQVQDY